MRMKRYLIFAFMNYYPAGGMNDLWGSADNLQEYLNSSELFDAIDEWHYSTVQIVRVESVTLKHDILFDYWNDDVEQVKQNIIDFISNFKECV